MLTVDQTGFPLVPCPALALEIGLLPVTRAQFDFYLGGRTNFDPAVLDELNAVSPRASWRSVPAEQPEGVFLTGVRVEEAEPFARWLGGGFRLATDPEWRACDATLGKLSDVKPVRALLDDATVHPAARAILNWSLNRRPPTWRSAMLLEDGVFEWVRKPTGFGLQGRPRAGLFRIIHNPSVHEAITPRLIGRHVGYGVRLVRPLTPQVP